MRKHLKLILLINFWVALKVSCLASDTLKSQKGFIVVGLNYGLPVYNKLTIYSRTNYKDSYSVKSKSKNFYDFSFAYNYKKLSYIAGFSYLQSEFEGKEFKMNAYNDSISIRSYILYQNVKYNVLYGNLGIGYNYKFSLKHQLSFNFILSFPALYDITINNIYSKNNQVNDTTLFEASKNAKNWDTNFGRLPRINIGVTYKYFFTSKLALALNLCFLYAPTYDGHEPEDYKYETVFNHSNNYSYLAYSIRKQMALTPSVGISYKLN